MTHDELLAKIEDDFDYDSVNHKFQYAVRAVVELHKPLDRKKQYEDLGFKNVPELTVCYECLKLGTLAKYSCETIQAIEKELS